MTNRWALTEEVKQKYIPVVEQFISELESINPEDANGLLEINLSDTELSPYTLVKLLEGMGYKERSRDDNGWQFDYWITMSKKGFKTLSVNGTAIIFELKLSEKEE
ncbi:hypothetical protein D3C71_1502710 [compost metagenome]